MKGNPFTSQKFVSIWNKHFWHAREPYVFKFINNVSFIKNKCLPIYSNVGKNLTKGIFYTLNPSEYDFRGKTFLIYDVPTYFDIETFNPPKNSSLRLKKVYQYQGFLMDISSYTNYDDYINAQFSSKNRREFRANMRKLETCFDIQYSFIHGEISQSDFDLVFRQFYELLNKRFGDKKTNYHHLSGKKWSYYSELVYEMLQDKKASLLVIYDEKKPIGVTLNFHSEDVLFETITVFDSDYYKFSIGKTSIIKLLEWCFENNYRISDFSKGDYDYKHKWGNLVYDFEYHIFYDSKSIKSRLNASLIVLFFKFKSFLRKKHLNELYRKSIFMLKNNKEISSNHNDIKFEMIHDFDTTTYEIVDYMSDSYDYLRSFVYTFLFANAEPVSNIKVYINLQNNKEFVINGSNKKQRINFV